MTSIYHIVHVNRLPSIVKTGGLLCDAEIVRLSEEGQCLGTSIGLDDLKSRRRHRMLHSRPGLRVGECVPFYFCPRSVMLHSIYVKNPRLTYRDGQDSIVHLKAELEETVSWAQENNHRWVITTSNASHDTCADYADLTAIREINWDSVHARSWGWHPRRDEKQAEFLLEKFFPWEMVIEIGVCVPGVKQQVSEAIAVTTHKPHVSVVPGWYY